MPLQMLFVIVTLGGTHPEGLGLTPTLPLVVQITSEGA